VAEASPSTMFTEAVAAARAGDRSHARELFTRLLRADSSNSDYWIWMSSVVDSERERLYCLESALKLDPKNRAAQRGLVIAGKRSPEAKEISRAPQIEPRDLSKVIKLKPRTSSQEREEPEPKKKPKKRKRTSRVRRPSTVFLVLIGAAALYGGYLLFTKVLFPPDYTGIIAGQLNPLTPTATDTPLSGTATATPLPAATRVVRTPIPTDLAGTPIAFFVEATPTNTPIAGLTPHPIYEAYQTGLNAFTRGDYEDAIDYFEQVLDLDNDLADVYYLKGEAHRLLGQNGFALQSFDRAVVVNPDYAPGYMGRGRMRVLQNLPGGPEDMEEAIEVDRTFIEGYIRLAEYYQTRSLWSSVESTLTSAIEYGAGTPLIYLMLSDAQMRLGRYGDALDNALIGSANDPSMEIGYLMVGRAYVTFGVNYMEPDTDYFESAIWPLETYLLYAPDDPAGLVALGRAYYELGRYEEALPLFDRALEINERYAPAYVSRALMWIREGDYEEAIDDLTSARRYAPETFELSLTLGRAYYLMEEYGQAQEALSPLVEQARNANTNVLKERRLAEVYSLLALIYETNPLLEDDAILRWQWVLELENALPQTRQMALDHLRQLTDGEVDLPPTSVTPTRTPTPTPTP
jgi:tetratricopeptide (TPR) repeat protein